RIYSRPGWTAAEDLAGEEERIHASELSPEEKLAAWRQTVRRLSADGPQRGVWLVGQDAAQARALARRLGGVAGILQALTERVRPHLEVARRPRPLAEESPLAVRHKTRFPIVQGPMTRVSDTAAFAEAVAAAGALPFLALALLRR